MGMILLSNNSSNIGIFGDLPTASNPFMNLILLILGGVISSIIVKKIFSNNGDNNNKKGGQTGVDADEISDSTIEQNNYYYEDDGSEKRDDDEGNSSDNMDWAEDIIKFVPKNIEKGSDDAMAISNDWLRTFQGEGKGHVVVSWPEEQSREWVEINAGSDINITFKSKPSGIEFEDNMFRLKESVLTESFYIYVNHSVNINSRELTFNISDTDKKLLSRKITSA
jgi:hypothetical protein